MAQDPYAAMSDRDLAEAIIRLDQSLLDDPDEHEDRLLSMADFALVLARRVLG